MDEEDYIVGYTRNRHNIIQPHHQKFTSLSLNLHPHLLPPASTVSMSFKLSINAA